MEINITDTIENTIHKLLKNDFGDKLATIYRRFCLQINFTIICLIAVLLWFCFNGLFASAGFFGPVFSFLVVWFWGYSMTIGSLAYIWGFKEKPVKKKKEEAKPDDAI